jgi:hypothetical protein
VKRSRCAFSRVVRGSNTTTVTKIATHAHQEIKAPQRDPSRGGRGCPLRLPRWRTHTLNHLLKSRRSAMQDSLLPSAPPALPTKPQQPVAPPVAIVTGVVVGTAAPSDQQQPAWWSYGGGLFDCMEAGAPASVLYPCVCHGALVLRAHERAAAAACLPDCLQALHTCWLLLMPALLTLPVMIYVYGPDLLTAGCCVCLHDTCRSCCCCVSSANWARQARSAAAARSAPAGSSGRCCSR